MGLVLRFFIKVVKVFIDQDPSFPSYVDLVFKEVFGVFIGGEIGKFGIVGGGQAADVGVVGFPGGLGEAGVVVVIAVYREDDQQGLDVHVAAYIQETAEVVVLGGGAVAVDRFFVAVFLFFETGFQLFVVFVVYVELVFLVAGAVFLGLGQPFGPVYAYVGGRGLCLFGGEVEKKGHSDFFFFVQKALPGIGFESILCGCGFADPYALVCA